MATRTKMEPLTKADVAGRFWVEASIHPQNNQDKMQSAQTAQMLMGAKLISRYDAIKTVLNYQHPEEVMRHLDDEMAEQLPEVQKVKMAALQAQWMDDHKDLVREADKLLNPTPDQQHKDFMKKMEQLGPDGLKQMIQMAAQMQANHNQTGVHPMDQMAQMDAAAQQQQALQQQMQMLPQSVAGGAQQQAGPNPQVMPSQMMMPDASAQTQAQSSPAQIAGQMARGKPQQGPSM